MAYPSNTPIAADRLRGIVDAIEASDERIASENAHKSEIYKEAKSDGFNVKALRKVIAARRMDAVDRAALDADFDLYMMHVDGLAHARVENIEQSATADHSTAARKDVPLGPDSVPATKPDGMRRSAGNRGVAGTQAPPVEATPILAATKKLRPYCLHADDLSKCGGQGRHHCHDCEKAHADAEGFSA